MNCSSCIGQLETRLTDGRELLVCPLCGHEDSVLRHRDAQRWWGNAHLPLLDIILNPTAAFRQLSEHPLLLANLLFFSLAGLLQWHFNKAQYADVLQKIAPFIHCDPHFLTVFIVAFSFFIVLFNAAMLHGAAKALSTFNSRSADATFAEILCTSFFLSALAMLLGMVPGTPKYIHWGLSGLGWFWLIWAIHIIYGFDVLKSAGTWALSWLFSAFVLVGIGLLGFLITVLRPSIFHASAAHLEPTHQAADYNWQVHTLTGQAISLNDLKGKVIFLNFWATWCAPCRMEMASIQNLYTHFKNDSHIVFLCVSQENAETVQKFIAKTKYTFPVYVTDGAMPPTAFYSRAIPVTYIISPQGQIAAEHTGASQWDSEASIQLLQKLAQSTGTVVANARSPVQIPKLAQGELNIPIHPMANFNFKTSRAILALRRAQVEKEPQLAPPHYQPDPAVFQIVDGLPWWGTAGLFFYSQGMKSIEGFSEESRFLLNPFLLVGLRESFVSATAALPPAKDDYVAQASALRWRLADKKAVAYYDFTKYLAFAERIHPLPVARTFTLQTCNARDLGYRYITIDREASQGVDIPQYPQQLIPLVAVIQPGPSCHYPGGCNNFNPNQHELRVEITQLPARVTLQLWRDRPFGAQRNQPDMTFELILQ